MDLGSTSAVSRLFPQRPEVNTFSLLCNSSALLWSCEDNRRHRGDARARVCPKEALFTKAAAGCIRGACCPRSACPRAAGAVLEAGAAFPFSLCMDRPPAAGSVPCSLNSSLQPGFPLGQLRGRRAPLCPTARPDLGRLVKLQPSKVEGCDEHTRAL